MRVPERLGDLLRQIDRFIDRELLLAIQLVAQRRPFDEGHRVEQPPVRLARIEDADDVRVLQGATDLDLAQETFGAKRRGELRIEHLERDELVVDQVVRQIHDRHPALTELALEPVLLRELAAKRRQGLRRDRRLGHAEPLKRSALLGRRRRPPSNPGPM